MGVFVSSHLLAEVELMCDRVAIIHNGRILREATMHALVSSSRMMEIRVGDVVRAAEVIRAMGVEFETNGDRLFVPIEEAAAPPLIAALTQNGVEVFHAQKRVQTLEETFLEATGGETVG